MQEYDLSCDDFSKIEKIQSLQRNSCKLFFFIVLSVLTLGLANLFMVWFPKLKLFFIYSLCDVEKATYFGIFGQDKKFYITIAQELVLPEIAESHLKKYCIFNVIENKIILFNYKLFKYIYLPKEQCFVSLKFSIKTSLEIIHKYFTTGLNNDEQIHQRKIFGVCDLEIDIDSVFKLLFKEISDPFYLF